MSELTATATATDELKLTPPEPLPPITPEKAAGLVPLSTDQKSKLEERVDGFIDDLIAQDENSPEFGKRIDQGVALGDALEKPLRDQCLAIQTALAAGAGSGHDGFELETDPPPPRRTP